MLRAAALIAIGFVGGMNGSQWFEREPARVTPAYITRSTPDDSLATFAVSDATGIPPTYYDRILDAGGGQ